MPKTNVYCDHKPNLSTEEAVRAVETYFGNAKHRFRYSCYGTTIYFVIRYFDFKPRRQVITELHSLIPNLEIESIQRELSPEAIYTAYMEAGNRNEPVYVKMSDGTMQPANLAILIADTVCNYAFTDKGHYAEPIRELVAEW